WGGRWIWGSCEAAPAQFGPEEGCFTSGIFCELLARGEPLRVGAAQPGETNMQLLGESPLLVHLLLDAQQTVLLEALLKILGQRRLSVPAQYVFFRFASVFDDEDGEPVRDWMPGEHGLARKHLRPAHAGCIWSRRGRSDLPSRGFCLDAVLQQGFHIFLRKVPRRRVRVAGRQD